MSIYRKIQAVERVFNSLEKELATFKSASGLSCVVGCGLCCHYPNITATPLEFLPLAYAQFKQDKAYALLDRLQQNPNSTCQLFKPLLTEVDKGFCGDYKYRGLICRLFGFSGTRDKFGKTALVTCKSIKASQAQEVEASKNKKIPLMSDYYYQLRTIDDQLGGKLMPINLAMIEALKVVLSYYAYRKPRRA